MHPTQTPLVLVHSESSIIFFGTFSCTMVFQVLEKCQLRDVIDKKEEGLDSLGI